MAVEGAYLVDGDELRVQQQRKRVIGDGPHIRTKAGRRIVGDRILRVQRVLARTR